MRHAAYRYALPVAYAERHADVYPAQATGAQRQPRRAAEALGRRFDDDLRVLLAAAAA